MTTEKEAEKKVDDGGDAGVALTVVLRATLHCEGCAHKVKRSIKKHFNGVESVKANYATGKVTVVGKVDPAKIKERLEEKTKKTVQLISPKPPKKPKDNGNQSSDENLSEKKPVEDEHKADEQKPKQDATATVVLKTRVHCDTCARKMNKIIKKCEGVEGVNVDMEKDKVTVKGTMDVKAMLPYLSTKLKRAVEIAPPPRKDDGSVNKPESDDKKGEEAVSGGNEGSKDVKPTVSEGSNEPLMEEKAEKKVEVVNKMEYNGTKAGEYGAHAYEPKEVQGKGYVVEYWNGPDAYNMHGSYDMNAQSSYFSYTPEIFSDENPNGCFIM